jgi:hypothetical protein
MSRRGTWQAPGHTTHAVSFVCQALCFSARTPSPRAVRANYDAALEKGSITLPHMAGLQQARTGEWGCDVATHTHARTRACVCELATPGCAVQLHCRVLCETRHTLTHHTKTHTHTGGEPDRQHDPAAAASSSRRAAGSGPSSPRGGGGAHPAGSASPSGTPWELPMHRVRPRVCCSSGGACVARPTEAQLVRAVVGRGALNPLNPLLACTAAAPATSRRAQRSPSCCRAA